MTTTPHFLISLAPLRIQTNSTPVLLGYKDRAELATPEKECLSSTIEGFVIVKETPGDAEEKN